MLFKTIILLQENIFVIGLFSLYTMGKLIHNKCFSHTRHCFRYVARSILKTFSTGVLKIHDLFTNSLFMTKKFVLGVGLNPRHDISVT